MVRSASAALCICCVSGVAVASNTVDLQYVGTDKGQKVRIVHGADTVNAFAGEIRHRFTNGQGLGAPFTGLVLDTYCVEVTEHVTDFPSSYSVSDDIGGVSSPLLGADKALAISRMYALLLGTQSEGGFDDDWAAGFQVAVWDVVYDYDAGVGRDSLSVDSGELIVQTISGGALEIGPRGRAELFFDAVMDDGLEIPTLFGFQNDGRQDQIVPAPGSLSLAGLGCAALVRRRRR